jgi:hypothetical protein
VISHPTGKRASFGEFAARAEQQSIPEDVGLKDRADYKLIGREGRLRVDAPAKILGTARFTIDVALPQMVTAVVLHPPRFGARPAAVDDRAALDEPGVITPRLRSRTRRTPLTPSTSCLTSRTRRCNPNNAVCRMGDDGILEVWAGTE